MAKRLYTKKTQKRPTRGLITGAAGLMLTCYLIATWNPDSWWKEIPVVLVGWLSVLLLTSWVFRKVKTGAIVSTALFSFLIMNRIEILSPVIIIGLVLLFGLLALVN